MTRDPEPLPTVERTAPGAADPDAVPAMARELDRLAQVDTPSLAPLVRWSSSETGLVLVHRVPDAAVALDVVRRGGPMRAGHALTAAIAVTEALVALHAVGLAHGGLDAGQVLVAPDGSVVLAGAGLGWRAAPGRLDGPRPEDDVAGVGDLVRVMLGRGGAPGPLVLAALRAADPDPSLRPDAAALLDLLRSCGRTESLLDALWLQGPTPHLSPSSPSHDDQRAESPPPPRQRPTGAAPRPGTGRAARDPRPRTGQEADADAGAGAGASPSSQPGPRSSRRRATAEPSPRVSFRTVAAVAMALLVGLGAVRAVTAVGAVASEPARDAASVSSGASAPPVPAPSSTTQSAEQPSDRATTASGLDQPAPATDWAAVLASLDAGRRAALASGDVDALARWVDPGGAAWVRDAALLQRLARADAALSGGEIVLVEVRLLRSEADRLVLAVRDRRAAYEVVEGGTTTRVGERAAAWWTVTLTALPALDGDGWRIAEVRGREDRAGG